MTVKQITNFSCQDLPVVDNMIDITSLLNNKRVIKLGYCCEPKGISDSCPLSLLINGNWVNVIVGFSGMYEFQPEVNVYDEETQTMAVYVTGIKVPDDIQFVLDLVIVD